MSIQGLRVAVTGATGFLGTHVVARLAERGAVVRVVYRDPGKARPLLEAGFEGARADLSDPAAMAEAFRGCDAVVATAALATRDKASYEAFHEANVRGSEHLMDALAASGVTRCVYVSSIAVYKARPFRRMGEDTPLVDGSARFGWSRFITNPDYSVTKAMGERVVQERAQRDGIAVTILRPGPIYGSADNKTIPIYERLAAWPLLPAPTFRIPHVHASDVAIACAGALSNPASGGRAYNVTGPSVSPYEILRAWKRKTGEGPFALFPLPLPVWVEFDDGAAERDLGFRARGIDEGLDEVFAAR